MYENMSLEELEKLYERKNNEYISNFSNYDFFENQYLLENIKLIKSLISNVKKGETKNG